MAFTSRYLTAALALLLLTVTGALVLVLHDGRHGGTLQGSGVPATQVRSVPAFNAVELSGSNNITVAIGGPRHVVVHADTNLLAHVTTAVRSGRLVVGNTPGSFATVTPMSVTVTVPSIVGLTISGSGTITADGGTAPYLAVSIAGSGTIHAVGVTARDVRAAISGSGEIDVTATRGIAAEIRGSGSIRYAGRPAHVTSSVKGSGSVIPF